MPQIYTQKTKSNIEDGGGNLWKKCNLVNYVVIQRGNLKSNKRIEGGNWSLKRKESIDMERVIFVIFHFFSFWKVEVY